MKIQCSVLAFLLFFIQKIDAQTCLPNGIQLKTQQQVDNFLTTYTGCRHVLGNVKIMGDDIQNFAGLAALDSIGGNLEIANLPKIETLAGLEGIQFIRKNFLVSGCPKLRSFASMRGLQRVSGSLIISAHEVSGLDSLEAVGHAIYLNSLGRTKNLVGFPSLRVIGDLDTIGYAGLFISLNDSLETVSGFEKLTHVHGAIRFERNKKLQKISGFSALRTVETSLEIMMNDSLRIINAFHRLDTVGFSLKIGFNPNLREIKGFDSLRYIFYELELDQNITLEDISAFDHDFLLSQLEVTGNSKLSQCTVELICKKAPFSATRISQNGSNCQSKSEILAICPANSVIEKEIWRQSFAISPYPVISDFEIKSPLAWTRVAVKKPTGKILRVFEFGQKMSLGGLPKGTYFLEITPAQKSPTILVVSVIKSK